MDLDRIDTRVSHGLCWRCGRRLMSASIMDPIADHAVDRARDAAGVTRDQMRGSGCDLIGHLDWPGMTRGEEDE